MSGPTRREVDAAIDLFKPDGAPPAAIYLSRPASYPRERAQLVADAASVEDRLAVLGATDGAFVVLVIGLASSLVGQQVAVLPSIDNRREAMERVPSVMRRQVEDHVRRVFAARRATSLRASGGADTPSSKRQSDPDADPGPSGGAR